MEAFYLFETINDRGKNLEIGDLLKNHFFSKLDESEREEYIDNWSKISSNTDNKLTTMLRHFYFTRDGYVGSKQLYESLKKLLNKNMQMCFKTKVSTIIVLHLRSQKSHQLMLLKIFTLIFLNTVNFIILLLYKKILYIFLNTLNHLWG